ncbi:MAG: glutathione peroxidase [Pseudomonadota bacterium]
MRTVFDFVAKGIDGTAIDLKIYEGKVLLIVNTASQCGFTPQYKGLEKVYQQFKDQGVEVLGFPCNQFGGQEPGAAEQISDFCELRFGVTFPLFDKIEVNGDRASPLFQHLKLKAPGLLGSKAIKWNFTKFLIKKDGTVYKRYAPATKPEELAGDIQKLLAENVPFYSGHHINN